METEIKISKGNFWNRKSVKPRKSKAAEEIQTAEVEITVEPATAVEESMEKNHKSLFIIKS